jgi:type IV secretion system protein VirB10
MSDPPLIEDRGRSAAAVARTPWVSRRTLTIVLVIGVAALGGFATWRMASKPEIVKEKLPEKLGVTEPYVAPKMALPPKPEPAALVLPPAPALPPAMQAQQQEGLKLPTQRSMVSNVQPPQPAKPHMLSYAVPEPRRPAGVPGSGPGGTDDPGKPPVTYASTSVPGIQAGLLGDQTFLLMPQLLPCTMDWAVNSTFEGPIECHIDRDIKPRGITLINRNAVVHGYYKGNVQEGQQRLFAAAEWMHDPVSGCVVNFDNAPVGDGIGQTGMTGNIDNRYMQRFGAAFALTGFQSMMQLLQAEIQKNSQGGNTYLSLGSGGGIDSLAAAILHKQIDIPAIISTHQGEEIAIITNKILNFSKCYTLQIKDR